MDSLNSRLRERVRRDVHGDVLQRLRHRLALELRQRVLRGAARPHLRLLLVRRHLDERRPRARVLHRRGDARRGSGRGCVHAPRAAVDARRPLGRRGRENEKGRALVPER